MKLKACLMDGDSVTRSITRIAHEIMENNSQNKDNLAIIGIRTRGVPIAERIKNSIKSFENITIPSGVLDITLYRDDLSMLSEHPIINGSDIPFQVEGKDIILVDDVMFTGRTVRAAIDAIMEMGRAKTIQLAVLIDRGHRELPFRADYVGKNVPTSRTEVISVTFPETDNEYGVNLYEK